MDELSKRLRQYEFRDRIAEHKTKSYIEDMGRPSKYNDEVADQICNWISEGKSLRSFCRDENNPGLRTVLDWLNDDEKQSFRVKYARAREIQAEVMADELLEIADDTKPDQLKLAHDKMKIETRQWIAAKLLPKKYGNIQHIEDITQTPKQLVIVTTDKDINT